jgi:hypothetical protein
MQQIVNAELGLNGTIYGTAPVQAHGTINGFSFYFRARWDEWTFSISEHSEIDPVDIQFVEQGNQYGYFAEGQYGGENEYKASYMENDMVLDILQRCSLDYTKKKSNT